MFIVINQQGLILELEDSQVITLEKVNPLFNDADMFFQDLSYPGKAGFTDQNILFFNLANLIETPNNYYLFPVRVEADGDTILTGNIKFRIAPDGFEFTLELNLTAINYLMKNIRMTEIRVEDGNYNVGSVADMEALMLDTCVNPDKYPFIFMPVFNENFCQQAGHYYSINNYDVEADYRRFRANADDPTWGWGQSPYWKLTYMLGVVAGYLGFTVQGSVLTDPYYKNICIYTRRAPADPLYYPSFAYMPNMKIADFLKQLRDRLHLIFDFDLTTRILTVESFKTVMDSPAIDLTPYIGNIIEQQIPDTQGLTVSLKSDEADEYWLINNGESKTYPPLFKLVIGDGSNEIVLDCGTLKTSTEDIPGVTLPKTSQSVIAIHSWGATGIPPDLSYTDQYDPTTLNNWPLRLIRFTGYKPSLSDGYNFPCGEGVPLDAYDTAYYQFLNDSKELIITAFFPPSVLAGLKSSSKYTFKTSGYNYCDILIEKMPYDFGTHTELAPTKIYARTLKTEKVSQVAIVPVIEATPPPDDGLFTIPGVLKAYFDPELHGIDQVEVQIIADHNTGPVGSYTILGESPGTYTVDPIKISTNSQFAGGAGIPAIYVWGQLTVASPFGAPIPIRDPTITMATLTVLRGRPQYILHRGLKLPFTIGSDGRSTLRIDFSDYLAFMADFYIIVF